MVEPDAHLAPQDATTKQHRQATPVPSETNPTADAQVGVSFKSIRQFFELSGSSEPALPPSNDERVTPRLVWCNNVKHQSEKKVIDFGPACRCCHNIWNVASHCLIWRRNVALLCSEGFAIAAHDAKIKTPRELRGVVAK